MEVFGPVPSRRLGQSLGINNIPPKVCSYSCVYCQLGRTDRMRMERSEFYPPEDLFEKARVRMDQLKKAGERVDYITFVADGEPTLDKNLGREIDLLRSLGPRVAVISNASLIWMDDVKEDLYKADWVSLKVDAVEQETWRLVDRPHGGLYIKRILEGIEGFASNYRGTLATETMLVKGVNDGLECISQIADFLVGVRPSAAYILVPSRPPAEEWVKRPDMDNLKEIYAVMSEKLGPVVEMVGGDEEDSFFFTGDIVKDVLSIASVHPIREDVIARLLTDRNCDWDIIEGLLKQGVLESYCYENKRFYVKKVGERGMRHEASRPESGSSS
ncbi:MAG: radical SAM protein [Clostridiales bacterium]|nr:radical SAM protein [Clostridiales bacterium]